MKPRGPFFCYLKNANYKYYRSAHQQLADRVAVPSRSSIGRRAGLNQRALSREIAGSDSFPLSHCLFESFSRKFLVNRKFKNLVDEFGSNISVA